MVEFERFTLSNGLRVLIHEDHATPMVAVNVLYKVGARDESPERTGFAHLFEHLMFGGSKNVPDFDVPIQMAGGDCNAFTNNDVTNYYDIAPAENLETLLWLESDRMAGLNINSRSLDVQRKVVVEEFSETCLNIPYGDAWHRIAETAYKKHPYRWPTIGLVPEHIKDAGLEDVKAFYDKYYCPNNAILVVGGGVTRKEAEPLIRKWFEEIPARPSPERNIPQEPSQIECRRREIKADIPLEAIYLAFHMPERTHKDYYALDLLSDILGNGKSSRLFKNLRKQQGKFAEVDAYITGSVDPGLLIIEGKISSGFTLEQAELAIEEQLREVKRTLTETELNKYKNKAISTLTFNETSVLNRAMNLAFFESIGDADLMNREAGIYRTITIEDINRVSNEYLIPSNSSVICYRKG